jgi:hypothetical protein
LHPADYDAALDFLDLFDACVTLNPYLGKSHPHFPDMRIFLPAGKAANHLHIGLIYSVDEANGVIDLHNLIDLPKT